MPTQSRIAVYLLAAVSILALPSAVQALPIFFRVDSITLQFAGSSDENAIVSIGASHGIGSFASWVPRASRSGSGSGVSFAQPGHAAAFFSGLSGSLSDFAFRDRFEGAGAGRNVGNGWGFGRAGGNGLNNLDGILGNLLGQSGIPALVLINLPPGLLNSLAVNPVTLSPVETTPTVPPAVPEPATLTLWASAVGALALGSKLRGRRRRVSSPAE